MKLIPKLFLAVLVLIAAPAFAAEPPSIEKLFKLPQYSQMRLSPDGKVLASWGGPGTAPGQFHFDERQMLGIAVDGSGNVYVSDPGNARVQKFSLDGKLMAVWK